MFPIFSSKVLQAPLAGEKTPFLGGNCTTLHVASQRKQPALLPAIPATGAQPILACRMQPWGLLQPRVRGLCCPWGWWGLGGLSGCKTGLGWFGKLCGS